EYLRTKFWALDEVETSRILTRHLKTVKFLGFNGEKRKSVVARFLLEHGNTLEEMVFSWSNQVKYNEKSMETLNEVSKFYKASSNVKLATLLEVYQAKSNGCRGMPKRRSISYDSKEIKKMDGRVYRFTNLKFEPLLVATLGGAQKLFIKM
nr:hypothetical protein [Tanacetum cinerariifolium]